MPGSIAGMGFTVRYSRTLPAVEVAGRHVKRYQVTVEDPPIDPAVQAAAEAFLPGLLPAPDPATPPATFVVLHRSLEAVWFNAYSWVAEDIVHCRASSATLAEPTTFAELTQPWIGCVWELPALAHERSAWVRHVLTSEPADLRGYLADTMPEGPTGAP